MASLKGTGKQFVEYEKRFEGSTKKKKEELNKTTERFDEKNRTEQQQQKQQQHHHYKDRAEKEEVIEDSHAEVLELVSSPSEEQLKSSLDFSCVSRGLWLSSGLAGVIFFKYFSA